MSYYPPGVTGREPQIAGYAEGEIYALCDGVIDATKVRFYISEVGGMHELHTAEKFTLSEHGVEEVDCKWAGRLDVQYVGSEAVGDCPRCGNEIRVDLERE